VLTVTVAGPWGQRAAPRLHITFDDEVLVIAFDLVDQPMQGLADDTVRTIMEETWSRYLLHNPYFGRAAQRLSGSHRTFGFAVTDAVAPLLSGISLFPSLAAPEGCEQTAREVAEAVPYVIWGSSVGPDPARGGLQSRRTVVDLAVDSDLDGAARRLLPSSPIAPESLNEGAVASAMLNVNLPTLRANFETRSEQMRCGGIAMIPGLLGAVSAEIDAAGALEAMTGSFGASLLDLRLVGGVPFADVYIQIGSRQPVQLSGMLQRAVEDATGARPTLDRLNDMRTFSYRIGLQFQLAVVEGPEAVGVSLGRVQQQWLTRVLSQTAVQTEAFLFFGVDGPRTATTLESVAEVANQMASELGMSSEATELLSASEVIDSFREIDSIRLTGRYQNNYVRFDSRTWYRANP
ncbi:MAG: hypothetical protein KC561_05190, partial [Myxococcales bacterium]|nr:hypothetical protein [Myxococcales bacterium]